MMCTFSATRVWLHVCRSDLITQQSGNSVDCDSASDYKQPLPCIALTDTSNDLRARDRGRSS